MGGRPWSSKGCGACRQRKVKCDLQKPGCTRCFKRGRICPGYSRDNLFFNHYSQSKPSGELANKAIPDASAQARAQRLPASIDSCSQKRMQLSAAFWESYYPVNLDIKAIGEVDLWFQLMANFMALPAKTKALENAISALSCLYLGAAKGDKQLMGNGMQLYNNAIRHVSSQLAKGSVSEDVIYTGVIFKAIDTFNCPSGASPIIAHMEGHNTLLRHSDAIGKNDLFKPVYKLLKQNLMYAPLILFKSSGSDFDYLKKHNDDPPFDELFEVYVGITSLVASARLIDAGSPNESACTRLLRQCLGQRKKALEWYYRHLQSIGGAPMRCPIDKWNPKNHTLPQSEGVFNYLYDFHTFRNAEMHVFFWKAMAILQTMIYQSRIRLLRHTKGFGSEIDPEIYNELRMAGAYADNICRAIPYWFQDKMGSYGVLKIMTVLIILFKIYTHLRHFKLFLWVQHVCKEVANDGIDLATCLSHVWWKYWIACKDPTVNFEISLVFNMNFADGLSNVSGDDATPVTEKGDSAELEVEAKSEVSETGESSGELIFVLENPIG
ncbi:protein kinase domain family protein [Penicillium herquei]|nr:protein kinase domain family protein [Penicillium herquei]